ncbi:MAG: aminopeptidase, partial [Proteobacteria bacterium]|nr:aminopeptidase [Pseudomonadota bacterium]
MTRVLWLLLLSLELSSCYSLNQAYWFNNAFNSRQSVQEALLRSDLASEDRQKLQLSRAVLKFAVQQGLNAGDSYQHFIPAGPGTVSHLLQAAYPDRLELLTWWFPIVGKVPYLGFFDKNDRDRRALELQNE